MALKRTLSKSTISSVEGIPYGRYKRSSGEKLPPLSEAIIGLTPAIASNLGSDTSEVSTLDDEDDECMQPDREISPHWLLELDAPVNLDGAIPFYLSDEEEQRISPSPLNVYYATSSAAAAASSTSASGGDTFQKFRLSSIGFCKIVLQYIDETYKYCCKIMDITFGQLSQTVVSMPIQYYKWLVESKLGIPWHFAGNIVKYVTDFICDADLRDATIGEVANFLRTACLSVHQLIVVDVLENSSTFFLQILSKFKYYLTDLWLRLGKIRFPCEFGAKSDTLFLCMECHREHF